MNDMVQKVYQKLCEQLKNEKKYKTALEQEYENAPTLEEKDKIGERLFPLESKIRSLSSTIGLLKSKIDKPWNLEQSLKFNGNRGSTILEDSYMVDDECKIVARSTTVDGKKYELYQLISGSTDNEVYRPWVESFVGLENGEQTFYGIKSNGGTFETLERFLSYDYINSTQNGIQNNRLKRNPSKDCTRTVIRDYQNGEMTTIESILHNKQGEKIGSYRATKQTGLCPSGRLLHTHTKVIISRIFDEFEFESDISDGLIREDYLNGKRVASIYGDGDEYSFIKFDEKEKRQCRAKYIKEDGNEYGKMEENYLGRDEERTDSMMPNKVIIYSPVKRRSFEVFKMSAYKFLERDSSILMQDAFKNIPYLPALLTGYISQESIDGIPMTDNYGNLGTQVMSNLADDVIEPLKEKHQQREQKQSKDNRQQQDWD